MSSSVSRTPVLDRQQPTKVRQETQARTLDAIDADRDERIAARNSVLDRLRELRGRIEKARKARFGGSAENAVTHSRWEALLSEEAALVRRETQLNVDLRALKAERRAATVTGLRNAGPLVENVLRAAESLCFDDTDVAWSWLEKAVWDLKRQYPERLNPTIPLIDPSEDLEED